MMMGKQKWEAEEKLSIVLEGLKNGTSVAELCRQHNVNQGQYYKWRDQFLSRAKEFFTYRGQSQEVAMLKHRITELERIIGKITIQNEILKKTEELINS